MQYRTKLSRGYHNTTSNARLYEDSNANVQPYTNEHHIFRQFTVWIRLVVVEQSADALERHGGQRKEDKGLDPGHDVV